MKVVNFLFSGNFDDSRKVDDHARLDDTSFHSADWNGSNSTDFAAADVSVSIGQILKDLLDILKGETERFVGWSGRRFNGVDGVEERLSSDFAVEGSGTVHCERKID